MESDRGIRCGHNPFVVGLVQVLVDQRMVKGSVDEVNAEVGEHEE